MDIDSLSAALQFDILIAFDNDSINPRRPGKQQAKRCVQMLVEEAAMHAFNARELPGIEDDGPSLASCSAVLSP